MSNPRRWLQRAFFAGAVTDAAAMVPLLHPTMARVLWGIDEADPPFVFAQRSGASLMAGWTGLLIWAYREPLERRFVALLTVQVILGMVASELSMVVRGDLKLSKLVPTFLLQTVLLALFCYAYVLSRGSGD